MTRGEVQKIFPPDLITSDYVDLLRLRPKIDSNMDKEQLHLEAKFTISNAKNDGMFNVVPDNVAAPVPVVVKVIGA